MTSPSSELNETLKDWSLPRLTSRVYWDLAIWMTGFGLVIGVVFPFAIIVLGVPAAISLRPLFFLGTLASGTIVGMVNFAIARLAVGARMRRLSGRMRYVGAALQHATRSGDWSQCSPENCRLEVDSQDELGEAARAFNWLLESLASSHATGAAISSVTDSFTENLAFDDLVNTILDQYMFRSGASAGAVLVVRDGSLTVEAQRNIAGDAIQDASLMQQALRTRAITSVDIPSDLAIDAVAVTFRPRQVLVVPAWLNGQALGAVILAYSGNVSGETTRLLEAFQPSTSVALNNALTHERLQRLAAVDPLTEAYNRRFGLNRLAEEFSRTMRTAAPLGLLSFDIDHFKKVNDSFGHLAGDRVLRSVSTAVRAALRAGDVLIRTGGEEFVVLVPGAGYDDLETLGERIRRIVELTPIDVGNAEITVTISVGGVTYYGSDARDPEELLAKVDEALYASKKSGRNRVTMSRINELIAD